MGNGGITTCIFNLGTRWRWVVSFTPRPLYPRGMRHRYPLDRGLGGSQTQSWHGSEEKKNSCPYQESKTGRSARSLVTILTELSRPRSKMCISLYHHHHHHHHHHDERWGLSAAPWLLREARLSLSSPGVQNIPNARCVLRCSVSCSTGLSSLYYKRNVGNPSGKKSLVRRRHTLKDNIKIKKNGVRV
jgi:hypothetical protein